MSEKVLTYAVVGLGLAAVFMVLKTPAKVIAASPAQQQRDAALSSFIALQENQAAMFAGSQKTTLDYLNRRDGLGLSVPDGWSIVGNVNLMNVGG